jgi:CRISPR-associated protein Csm5
MKTYKLKLTALSPIHIGTGEDYEPINYVIDKTKVKLQDGKIVEKDYMFIFDEMEFYKNLDNVKKQEFDKIVSDTSYDARFKLYSFIVSNKEVAKKIAYQKIIVFSSVANDYYKAIGKVVNKESDSKKVFNSFIVAKTYISPNTQKPLLLGSSLKGSISTAYQEKLFKDEKSGSAEQKYQNVEQKMLKPTEQNLFKNFLISDANPIKQATFVDEAINRKRNKESKDDKRGVKIRLQAITQTSEFQTQVSVKEGLDFQAIATSCNDHYLPLFKSQFSYETDEFTRKYLSTSFITKYENWLPAKNQFLLKVGKYSGARAVTVDGIRRIKIIQGKEKPPRIDDEETTFWSINKLPFGWLLCEITE